MNEYLAERQAKHDALHTLAQQIAAHLPEEWTYQPPVLREEEYPSERAQITHTDGAVIHLSRGRWNNAGRLNVSGIYPSDVTLDGDHPSITLADNRPPEKLAREIQRRFVPAYLTRWQKAQEQCARNAQVRTQIQDVAEQLAGITGYPVEQIRYERSGFSATLSSNPAKLIVTYQGQVEIHATVNPTLACRLLKQIMEDAPDAL